MTRKLGVVAILLAVAVVCRVPLRAQPANASNAVEQSVESRVQRDYPTVLGRLWPPDPDPKSRLQKCKWRLVIFIGADEDHLEQQLAFERMYDWSAQVEVFRAKDRSIRRQLEMLYAVEPQITVDNAISRMAFSRARLDDSREVKAWIRRLERASIPAAIQMDLYMHGTAYEAWSFGGVESSAGNANCWTLQLVGPGPGARKQPNAFLDLIEEIRRSISKLGTV